MAGRTKFTRIPKVPDLISCGIPAEVIPTYCALTDYSNNRTGECYPKMETLAKTLKRSVRTIQRHLHLLRERGVIEFVERRRHQRGDLEGKRDPISGRWWVDPRSVPTPCPTAYQRTLRDP